jgi:hypothetical protein
MLTETTIGEHFHLADATMERIVVAISDGEFDPTFLGRYQHIAELRVCCVSAVERMAADPFVGRKSCADVMGRSMELLRHLHGLNAPGGWVPVIRALRSSPGSLCGRNVVRPMPVGAEVPYTHNQIPPPPPEKMLTDSPSALQAADSECKGVLLAYAEQHPEFMDVLVKIAQNHGVPTSWAQALLFLDAVVAELGEAVPESVRLVQKRLTLHCADYPESMKPRRTVSEVLPSRC